MKRSEWLDLEKSKQLAAGIAFTPEEKHKFWLEKLNEVLTLKWSGDEKKHISELYNWIYQNPDIFKNSNKESVEYVNFEKYMYQWSEEGKAKFGWNKQILSAIAMDGNKMIDITGNMEKRIKLKSNTRLKVPTEIGLGKTCSCYTMHNYCDNDADCVDHSTSKCNTTNMGCGWLTWEKCDGYCKS